MTERAINEGGTLSTIFSTSRYVIKKQRQLLILGGIFLRVLNIGFVRGLQKTVGPEIAQQLQTASQSTPNGLTQNIDRGLIMTKLPVLGVGAIVMAVIYLLVFITITSRIFQTIEHKEQPLLMTFRQTLHKLLPYIGTSIVQGVCLFGLLLLLVIPGLIFLVYWYFSLYVVIYTGKSGMSAMKESKAIVQHRRRKTLGYMLLIGIIIVIAMIILMSIVGTIVGAVRTVAISAIVTKLISYISQLFILVVVAAFFIRREKTRITQTVTQS